jgi:cytoskeletal protein CcmA (bactofilin family)
MIQDQDFRDFRYNVLGAQSTIIGDVVLSGDAIITSRIEGSLEMQGEGRLVLERGSFIKGRVKARDLEVFGVIEGDVECSGTISVRSSARLTGTLKSGKLVIYPGAILEMDVQTTEA